MQKYLDFQESLIYSIACTLAIPRIVFVNGYIQMFKKKHF